MAAERLRAVAGAALVPMLLLVSCAGGPATIATTPTDAQSTSRTATTSVTSGLPDPASTPAEIDATDYAAITSLVKQINRSSDSLEDQKSTLLSVVHPSYAGEQQACPQASVTVLLDPAYPDLRPEPAWTPAGATAPPSGSLYRLPALVEVYTDGLRTGTDLTLLRVSVLDGQAYTFPLCLV